MDLSISIMNYFKEGSDFSNVLQKSTKNGAPYSPFGGLSGKERLKLFMINEVKSGNSFHPNEFKQNAGMFGLKPTSIDSAFNTLLKEGIVTNSGINGYSFQLGKKPSKTWYVV